MYSQAKGSSENQVGVDNTNRLNLMSLDFALQLEIFCYCTQTYRLAIFAGQYELNHAAIGSVSYSLH